MLKSNRYIEGKLEKSEKITPTRDVYTYEECKRRNINEKK